MIFHPIFQWCHTQVFFAIFAKERGIGEIQVVGYLLHRHVGEAQAALNGFQCLELYISTRPAIHHFLENGREIFRRDIQLTGKFIHPADAAVALFH